MKRNKSSKKMKMVAIPALLACMTTFHMSVPSYAIFGPTGASATSVSSAVSSLSMVTVPAGFRVPVGSLAESVGSALSGSQAISAANLTKLQSLIVKNTEGRIFSKNAMTTTVQALEFNKKNKGITEPQREAIRQILSNNLILVAVLSTLPEVQSKKVCDNGACAIEVLTGSSPEAANLTTQESNSIENALSRSGISDKAERIEAYLALVALTHGNIPREVKSFDQATLDKVNELFSGIVSEIMTGSAPTVVDSFDRGIRKAYPEQSGKLVTFLQSLITACGSQKTK